MDKIEIASGVLADVLYELNPSKSKEEWLEHINKTGGNPKAFFGDNVEGLNEYQAFIKSFDKDTYDMNKKRKDRKRKK